MKLTAKYIALLLPLAALSCSKTGLGSQSGVASPASSPEIDASCAVMQVNDSESSGPGIATKGIIGQTTVTSLNANFIKRDEIEYPRTQEQYSPQDFNSWEEDRTYILDASILSSPDNTPGIYLRSVVFNPRQTYPMYSYDADNDGEEDTSVGYITRMVGWYPKTYELLTGTDGKPATTRLDAIEDKTSYFDTYQDANGNEHECIIFKNKLDGETDLMVTDMREGRYDLRGFGNNLGFKNNINDYDVQPYGHQFVDFLDPSKGFKYLNYFTFKHYLTCVRLFIQTDASNLSLIGYKQIHDVIFTNQPTSVAIALPTVQSRSDETVTTSENYTIHKTLPHEGVDATFGEALDWWDPENMHIIRTPLAVNDPDHPEFAEEPSYPVTMSNVISLDKVYMGYMLVRPDVDTSVEIHTDAGIYDVTIKTNARYKVTAPDGTESWIENQKILEAGHIYNVVIDVKTEGSIDIIVENEDDGSFRNLAPYNTDYNEFEYSNCYVVTKDMMVKSSDASGTEYYDGFYFQAITPGRGSGGWLNVPGADTYPDDYYFEPYSVRILWQDQSELITHVELVHGYVRFMLNERCKTGDMKGNAVLAAYDQAGEILWSWHIWVTDEPEEITFSYTTATGNQTFGLMNMNLGATRPSISSTDSPEAVLDCYGLYYQWGRKDPSPGPSAYNYNRADLSTKTYYYMDEGARNSVLEFFDPEPTIEMSAEHPLEIIAPTSLNEEYANDWLFDSIDQLWGYSPSSGKVEKKTIYDPCPYGWRVADNELSLLLSNGKINNEITASDGTAVGLELSLGSGTGFFPYTGWRGHDVGRTDKTHAWFGVGEVADYQDARVSKETATNNHRGRQLLVKKSLLPYSILNGGTYENQLTNGYTNRTTLAPVRCVRYNASDEEPDNPTQ